MENWESYVRKVVPYVPGEQPQESNQIKLNTNENPYPPAPGVVKALQEFQTDRLRLYPEPTCKVLVDAIAEYYHLKPEQVFVGVGSDDVLAMIFLTFFNAKTPIVFPDITYSFYDVWAELFRIPYVQIPLQKDFRICIEDYKRENGGIVIPNPNAPTGIAESLDAIEEILKTNPDSVVIIDEAYVDFGTKSALALLPKYENLLVVQTFSKSRSLAGSRIGYAMGSPKLISYLNDCKYSFNSYTMDRLTIQIGKASMEDTPYFKEQVDRIVETREWAKEQLRRLGFTFLDSKANFIFASHAKMAAAVIFAALKEKDIYVRYFNKPRIDNFLRITIGTKEEMERLFAALEEILQQA